MTSETKTVPEAVEQSGRLPIVPLPVLISAVVVGLAAVVMMVGGAITGGITWDEKVHVIFLETFQRYGWNVDSAGIANGAPDPNLTWGIYVYGPVASLIGHGVDILLGYEQWGILSSTPEAYVGRHIASVLFGLLGAVAVAFVIRLLMGSWRWAVLGAVLAASIPLWVGQSMFNIKDVPVAAGYTLATAGLVALAGLRKGRHPRRVWFAWGAIVVGTVLAAGTRAASGMPVAVGVIGLALVLLLYPPSTAGRGFWARLKSAIRVVAHGIGALVLSYLILLAIYPKAFINPILLAYEALYVSARFPFDESVMTNGRWMQQPVSWTYLPEWFGAQLPLLILIGSLAFLAWWIVAFLNPRAMKTQPGKRSIVIGSSPVLIQALALPLGAIVAGSNIYNGTRQFFFVVPAAAILATLAIGLFARFLKARQFRGGMVVTLWTLVVLGIVLPTISQAFLYPYNYVYYNLPASLAGIDGRWPTDYWRQSARELVQRLPAEGPESCAYEQYRKDQLFPCMGIPTFSTYADERGSKALPGRLKEGYYWYVRENQGNVVLPAGCESFDSITRQLNFTTITIGEIAQCPLNQATAAFESPAE